MTDYEAILEQTNFRLLIQDVVRTLQERSARWVTNLESLHLKLEMIIKGILESKIISATEVKDLL